MDVRGEGGYVAGFVRHGAERGMAGMELVVRIGVMDKPRAEVRFEDGKVVFRPLDGQALSPGIAALRDEGYNVSATEGYKVEDGEAFVRNLPRAFHSDLFCAKLIGNAKPEDEDFDSALDVLEEED